MPASRSILNALPATRFRDVGRPAAIAILAALLIAVAALLMVAQSTRPPAGAASADAGDQATYERIVERMRAGEGYYAAAHDELLTGGFGTRSVFNWRLPALPWLASRVPAGWADAILRLVAVAAALAMAAAMRRHYGTDTALLTLGALAINLLGTAATGVALFADVVAGVLILAAVGAYGLGRPLIGVAIALAALFVRELAAPAICVFILLAWTARRRTELVAWGIGLAAFAAYFAWHAASVHAQLGPADPAYPSGWVQFGGLAFILATASFNGLMMLLPPAATALLLPLCLLGLAGWQGALARRVGAAVAVYLLLFAVVGKPFNFYWGALYTPLMMLGLPLLPAALRDLARAIANRAPAPVGG